MGVSCSLTAKCQPLNCGKSVLLHSECQGKSPECTSRKAMMLTGSEFSEGASNPAMQESISDRLQEGSDEGVHRAMASAEPSWQLEERTSAAIKAVIFDMDNTLFDFVEAKLAACKAVADALGGDAEELLRYFARDATKFEGHANIADYMAEKGLFEDAKYLEACSLYERVKLESISPYPGIREALSSLKGMGLKLGVATNSTLANAVARLNRTKLIGYFDAIVAAESKDEMKPKPDVVERALLALGVAPGEAIMVGDSLSRDIAAGRSLGMLTAYAKYGDRNLSKSRTPITPDFVLNSVQELVPVLEKVEAGSYTSPMSMVYPQNCDSDRSVGMFRNP